MAELLWRRRSRQLLLLRRFQSPMGELAIVHTAAARTVDHHGRTRGLEPLSAGPTADVFLLLARSSLCLRICPWLSHLSLVWVLRLLRRGVQRSLLQLSLLLRRSCTKGRLAFPFILVVTRLNQMQ